MTQIKDALEVSKKSVQPFFKIPACGRQASNRGLPVYSWKSLKKELT
jgi:hypothetical protein